MAFVAESGRGVFRRDEDVADIVVEMGRLGAERGDRVDVEIEWASRGDDQSFDARFFERFLLRHPQHVLLAFITVAPELEANGPVSGGDAAGPANRQALTTSALPVK